MTKSEKRLIGAAREAVTIARGQKKPARLKVPPEIDVKAIRTKLSMSQKDFAAQFGFTYDQIKAKFVELYWGPNGDGSKGGFVNGEKWLLPKPTLRSLAKRAELAIFTGRVAREMDWTLNRQQVRGMFQQIVTADDVKHGKPAPDGLIKILHGRDPQVALYLGDNVDDANAARAAGVPFVGVLPRNSEERRQRGAALKTLGALTIIGHIKELQTLLPAR